MRSHGRHVRGFLGKTFPRGSAFHSMKQKRVHVGIFFQNGTHVKALLARRAHTWTCFRPCFPHGGALLPVCPNGNFENLTVAPTVKFKKNYKPPHFIFSLIFSQFLSKFYTNFSLQLSKFSKFLN